MCVSSVVHVHRCNHSAYPLQHYYLSTIIISLSSEYSQLVGSWVVITSTVEE